MNPTHACTDTQRGAALLTAMLTVTLVATLAAGALWQQWRSVEVEVAERARTQSAWILTGALDWARLILREDARSGGADHLGEPWAVPLEEAQLATFLAAEQGVTQIDDSLATATRAAFLSGQIVDMQSRLNASSLVQSNVIATGALQQFERLFARLGLPVEELARLAENLRFAADRSPSNRSGQRAALWPQRLDDLRWLGLSDTTLHVLEPHVTVLPTRTPVNLNTASAEVLQASIAGLDSASAQRLLQVRDSRPFQSLNEVAQAAGIDPGLLNSDHHAIASRFFEIRGRLRLDSYTMEERSLVQRDGQDVRILWRTRGMLSQSLPTMPASSPGP